MIDDKGNYQTVIAIHTEATPLNSYNLEVDVDHTFFIKGVDGVDSVWVHNDCYRQLPNGSKKQSDGTYIANVNGKQITLIETKVGNETKYYTPDHKKGDPYRNKVGQAVDEKGRYITDPNKPQDSADKYKWIDEHRHPDPNVQSSFSTSKPITNSTYFTTQTEWQAPGKGTGLKYTVYQQDIDLNARPLAHLGNNKTNAELMQKGNAPYVLKNGKYEQIQLHHSQQDGRGSLFELTEASHQTNHKSGGKALHPYSPEKHPDYAKHDGMFRTDQSQYWKDRIKHLQSKEVN